MCHWAEIKHVCVKGKIMSATCCEGENFARLFCMFYLSSFFFFFLVKCVILVERCLLIHFKENI